MIIVGMFINVFKSEAFKKSPLKTFLDSLRDFAYGGFDARMQVVCR